MAIKRTLCLTQFLLIVFVFGQATANDGLNTALDQRTYGRFLDWPITETGEIAAMEVAPGRWRTPFEDDLAKRVYPDRIVKTHRLMDGGRRWRLHFGVRDSINTVSGQRVLPTPTQLYEATILENSFTVRTEETNWTSKKFSVLRKYAPDDSPLSFGDFTEDCLVANLAPKSYSLRVFSASPGTWLETKASMVYIDQLDVLPVSSNVPAPAPSDRVRITHYRFLVEGDFFGSVGVVADLNNLSQGTRDSISQLDTSILLWGAQTGPSGSSTSLYVPVLVSPERGWTNITHNSSGFVQIEYSNAQNLTHRVGLSLPLGVDIIEGASNQPGTWTQGSTEQQELALLDKMVRNPVVDVYETYSVDATNQEVSITNTYAQETMPGSTVYQYAPIPPLINFAHRSASIDGAKLFGSASQGSGDLALGKESQHITKYGPYSYLDNATSLTYELSGPPI